MKRILFLLLLGLTACENGDPELNRTAPPIDFLALMEEHNQTTWDSAKIVEALQGNWLLINQFCCGFGEKSHNDMVNENIILSIDSLTYQLSEKQEIVQEGILESVQGDVENCSIKTNPRIQETDGRMFIGDSLLVFNLSFIDAYVHYFKRIE